MENNVEKLSSFRKLHQIIQNDCLKDPLQESIFV